MAGRKVGSVADESVSDSGNGAIYRNVTIAEIEAGDAVRVTDYWGKPFDTPDWRKGNDGPARYAGRRSVAFGRPALAPLNRPH
jgi:hypothetical protein